MVSCLFLSLSLSWGDDFKKAYDAYQKKEYAIAFKGFKKLAEQRGAHAQFNLGEIYRRGYGVPQDYREAVRWYTLAAEKGYVDAMFNLGVIYKDGIGANQDKVYSHMWWNIAASYGDDEAREERKKLEKSIFFFLYFL